MPWPLGTAAVQQRLKQLLGIRGNLPLELDETIVPVVSILEAERGPVTYPMYGTAGRTDPAVALQFSHVGVRGAVGTILVVDRVVISNTVNAGPTTFIVGLDTNPTADASDAVVAVNQFSLDLTNPRALAASAYDFTNATQAVSQLDSQYRVPVESALEVLGPWILYAPTAALVQSVVVTPAVVNATVMASFFVREYDAL